MKNILVFTLLILGIVLIVMPSQVKIGSRTFYRQPINIGIQNFRFVRDLEFKLGLDLQGGVDLVYQADVSKIPSNDRNSAIQSTRQNIERRVNLLGVSEPLIQTSRSGNDYRLIVELAGVKDVSEALDIIGRTAQLDFRETVQSSPSAQPTFIPTTLTGKDLQLAQVQFNGGSTQTTGEPSVAIQFTPEGAKKFAEITKRNTGKPLAIYLDDEIITAPTVRDTISDGKAVISGQFSLEDAKRLAIQLNAGALPVPIKIIEQRSVGATLGSESIVKSLFAGIVGFVLVWIFMIVNYGVKGLLANIALTIYVFLSLAVFKLVPVTLTLAGIAGFILSVGMAVDANILIFERIKEEIRWGRSPHAALELGFHRAWSSVRDSNVSSLITAGILFWFGSGSVRGFALTLILGIFVSLFTSIFVSRTLLRAVYSK